MVIGFIKCQNVDCKRGRLDVLLFKKLIIIWKNEARCRKHEKHIRLQDQ